MLAKSKIKKEFITYYSQRVTPWLGIISGRPLAHSLLYNSNIVGRLAKSCRIQLLTIFPASSHTTPQLCCLCSSCTRRISALKFILFASFGLSHMFSLYVASSSTPLLNYFFLILQVSSSLSLPVKLGCGPTSTYSCIYFQLQQTFFNSFFRKSLYQSLGVEEQEEEDFSRITQRLQYPQQQHFQTN